MSEERLRPDGLVLATRADEKVACLWCEFYSQKVFSGFDLVYYNGAADPNDIEGSGKCFVDYEEVGHAWWVQSRMVCPKFQRAPSGPIVT